MGKADGAQFRDTFPLTVVAMQLVWSGLQLKSNRTRGTLLCANASSGSSILWVPCTKMFPRWRSKFCKLCLCAGKKTRSCSQIKSSVRRLAWSEEVWSCSFHVDVIVARCISAYGEITPRYKPTTVEEARQVEADVKVVQLAEEKENIPASSWGSPEIRERLHFHLSTAVLPCMARTEDTPLTGNWFKMQKQRCTPELTCLKSF